MANVKIRYIGDEVREVSILPEGTLRRVEPDEVFEVDAKVSSSYECQPHMYEVDEPATPANRAPAQNRGN